MCFAFLMFGLVVAHFRSASFESNDDEFINLLSAGAFGPQSQYLVHLNTALGFMLRGLFALVPGINWFYWLMLIANLGAVYAILRRLTGRLLHNAPLWLTFLFCVPPSLLFFRDYLFNMQYTKSGMLYSAAGLLLLYEAVLSRERNAALPAFGTLFSCLGLMFRWKCFAFVLPFFLAALGLGIMGEDRKRNLKECRLLLLPALALSLLFLFDHISYESDPAWKQFREFNTLREEILDYNTLEYEAHEAEYKAAGILPEELAMLRAWMYADPQVFTPEKLKTIREILYRDGSHSLTAKPWVLRQMGRVLAEHMKTEPLFWFCGILILTALALGSGKQRLSALVLTGILMGELWYLICMGRPLWRAEVGAFLGTAVFSLTAADAERIKAPKQLLCLISILFISIFCIFQWIHSGEYRYRELPDRMAFFEEFHRQYPHSFLLGTPGTFLIDNKMSDDFLTINGKWKNYFEGVAFLGGWIIPSPSGLYFASQEGIEDPVRDIISNPGILLAAEEDELQILQGYLTAEYKAAGEFVPVDEIDGIPLWRWEPVWPFPALMLE